MGAYTRKMTSEAARLDSDDAFVAHHENLSIRRRFLRLSGQVRLT